MSENFILAIIAISITLLILATYSMWRLRMQLPSSPDEEVNEPIEEEKPKRALQIATAQYHQWIARLQRPQRHFHSNRVWFTLTSSGSYSVNSIGVLALVLDMPSAEMKQVIATGKPSDYFQGLISLVLGELEEHIYLWGEAGYSSVEISALIEAYVATHGGMNNDEKPKTT